LNTEFIFGQSPFWRAARRNASNGTTTEGAWRT